MQQETNLTKPINAPEIITSRYIDFKLDFSFHHFFAKEGHLDLLKDFLNSVFEGRKVIKEIRLGKTERKGDQKNNRKTVFDVYCTGDRNENFIVEMPRGNQTYFKDRILFYTANLVQEQGRSVERTWNYKFYDKLGYIYIELPRFTKTLEQLETAEDKWLYCLNHMTEFEEIPVSLSNSPTFKKLFEVAEVSNLTPEEMNTYQKELKRKRDNYSHDQHILEQGIEQGLAQGKHEKAIETAIILKSRKIDIEVIAEATGLSLEEIQSL